MKNPFEILIIDDSADFSENLKDILEGKGYGVIIAPDATHAISICRKHEFGLALIDIRLPDSDGMELVEKLSGILPEMEFIIITGYGTMEIAVEAVRQKKIVSFEVKPLDLNRFLALLNQIQERRRAAEALRISEQRFHIFAESATDAIISIDEEGRIFYLNPEFENIFGYKAPEMLGKPITLLMNPQEQQAHSEAFDRISNPSRIRDWKRVEVQGKHKSGKIVPLEISFGGFATKEGKFYTAIVRDITERKMAEINIQRKLLIEKIVSTISARFVGITDFEQSIYDSLKEICRYYEARSAFLIIRGKKGHTIRHSYSWSDDEDYSFPPARNEDLKMLFDWFLVELGLRQELVIPETAKLSDDQVQKPLLQKLGINSLVLLPIKGKGEAMGCLGLDNIQDPGRWTIEEFNLLIVLSNLFSSAFQRRMVEQELMESEAIHTILLDATREGIAIMDPRGMIREVSNIALEIFQASDKESIIGKSYLEFVPEESHEQAQSYYLKTVTEGMTQNQEVILLRSNGSRFVGEVNVTVLREENREIDGFLVVIRDITERKKMDKQLIHTERMAGIGVMAAGMAHEINQPLNTISLTMDNLLMSMNQGIPDKDYLEGKTRKIFEHITRIRNIIDHVRAFSKDHDDYIHLNFDINESIRNAKSMVSDQFRHNGIHLTLNLDGKLPQPLGNTYKFEQVIVNLILNAKDAIEEKSEFLKNGFSKIIEIRSFLEDHLICVEVKDNGIGIEQDEIDKVMLPFYSTKKEGMGTGLGLSISFGIIQDMNGTIEIHSERQIGTAIKIMIPVKNHQKENG
jgi:PAS domain S-box-containing protein